ncbi:hypothetical protein [Sphingomonas sp.]|jgi:hypothetical protein|uniref:hypothetical protein n=1 Tax=Sphingomonas sp. TaxID=28214 RepID=UPI002EDA594E
MRKTLLLVPALALGLAACSETSQGNLSNSLDRAGESIENVADDAGESLENGADRAGEVLGNAAEDVGERAEGVGNAVDNATR